MSVIADLHLPAQGLREGALQLQARHRLWPGLWLFVTPDLREMLELLVDGQGLRRVTRLDLPLLFRPWRRLSLISLAWLIGRAQGDSGGVARFSWSELGRCFGHQHLAAKNADALRAAVSDLCQPRIHHLSLELRETVGSRPAPAIESVLAPFSWPPQLHERGSGRHDPRQPSSEIHLEARLAEQFGAGLWSALTPEQLRAAPDDVTRRLWWLAPLLTARPAEGDGVCRVELPDEALRLLLGSGDARRDRAQRALRAAATWINDHDPRFTFLAEKEGLELRRLSQALPEGLG